ncbi:hypothetical protein [Actinophytocola sp.]|uniref:hypothetical protein n=1 Tax=Actinophytocola sp. TaxID=1872138 RepID=UPI002D68BCA6|nr:hypothetical protein [Actinophytocola sp.]HYQ70144.1 hypothetical protein [Actinophytocola sp.]
MRRLFWLGVGVAAGVTLSRKARQTAKQATPAGIAGNLGDAISGLAGAIGSFGADVRAGMEEREEELSEVVEQRSGVTPVTRRALGVRDEGRRRASRPTDARARRAGS